MTFKSKNLLVVYLSAPASLGKSAQMVTLKYLPSLGWNPTVITVPHREIPKSLVSEWCGINVITAHPTSRRWRLAQSLFQARSRFARGNISVFGKGRARWPKVLSTSLNHALFPATAALSFPDRYRQAAPLLLETARQLHQQQKFQAVLSVYDPITAHSVAQTLAKEMGIPWVAVTKDYYSKPPLLISSYRERVTNWVKASYERAILSKSDGLLPVFDNMVEYYQKLVPGVKVSTLTHCYDDEDFERQGCTLPESDRVFRVLWTGEVQELDDKQPLGVFFQAVGELVSENAIDRDFFRVRFVGGGGELARSYAKGSGAEELLETIPRVSHEEAMQELRQATCLLYTQVPRGGRRRLPEYLASRRPILAFPVIAGVMSQRVLNQYGAAAVVPATKPEIKAVLTQWYQRFKAEGELLLPVNEEVVKSFSASKVAQELSAVLEEAIGKKPKHQLARQTPDR